ncbi:MAG: hypothetical protein GF329_06280, partial [Candidatus Lokiarchaeota archaeon]|nr:hypothetical protein [Candidatus Lokiarchaeota archaeon]
MDSIIELKNQAEELRKNKNYSEAIKIYEKIISKDDKDKYINWGYASCSRKLNDVKKAFNIAQKNYLANRDYQINNNLYAWCHYDLFIKSAKSSNEKNFLKAAQKIISLTSQDKYSPYVKTVFKVISNYANNIYNAVEILKWLEELDVNKLNDQPTRIEGKDIKSRKFESDKCKYYRTKCKALLKLNKHRECIDTALEAFDNLKYDDLTWIKYYCAQAYFYSENYSDAVRYLQPIYGNKKEWYVANWLMKSYDKLGDYEVMEKYAYDAYILPGDDDKKIEFYKYTANVFNKKKDLEKTKNLIKYVYLLKKDMTDKVDNDLMHYIKVLKIDIEKIKDIKELKINIDKIFTELKYKDQQPLKGYIKNILSNGKSGFISAGSNDYYFNFRSVISNKNQIKVGGKANFYLEDSYDKKKNTKTKMAV